MYANVSRYFMMAPNLAGGRSTWNCERKIVVFSPKKKTRTLLDQAKYSSGVDKVVAGAIDQTVRRVASMDVDVVE